MGESVRKSQLTGRPFFICTEQISSWPISPQLYPGAVGEKLFKALGDHKKKKKEK